jgi:hypothetical protein
MVFIKTPELLQQDGLNFTEKIMVHEGFKGKILRGMTHFSYTNRPALTNNLKSLARTEYLFDDDIEGQKLNENESKKAMSGKYGKILRDLEECYNCMEDGEKVHDGFSLYVTGHRYVRATLCKNCPSL